MKHCHDNLDDIVVRYILLSFESVERLGFFPAKMIVKNEYKQRLELTLITTFFAKNTDDVINSSLLEYYASHIIERDLDVARKANSKSLQFLVNWALRQ